MNELQQLIQSTKGRFFSITFQKKDGSLRTINGKGRYDRMIKGGENNATNALRAQGYVSFINRNNDDWACAHTDKVVRFQCGDVLKVFPVIEVSV